MLMQKFHEWRTAPNNRSHLGSEISRDNFSIFYQEYSAGKNFFEMQEDLAHQIYELQECVEGLIEDNA